MLLSAVSFLAVAQLSSEIPEGLMNNPVLIELLFGIELFGLMMGCFGEAEMHAKRSGRKQSRPMLMC